MHSSENTPLRVGGELECLFAKQQKKLLFILTDMI